MTHFWSTNPHDNATKAIFIVQKNTANTALSLGYSELNYTGFPDLSNNPERRKRLLVGLLSSVQAGDTVVVQFPLWTMLNFQAEFFDFLKARGTVLVALIHDVPTWQWWEGGEPYDPNKDFWLTQLKKFDALITANDKMSHRLQEDGITAPMVAMQLWDYHYDGFLKEKTFKKQLYYAGGRKIESIDYKASTPLLITADAVKETQNLGSVQLIGTHDSRELMTMFDGGFGVVNYHNIHERSNFNWDYYGQFNNPTKLSMYLAAGLPVIVPSNSAHADWVKNRGVGLVLDDLNTIDGLLSNLTEADYEAMLEAVKPWQEAVSEGFFVRRALLELVNVLELGLDL
jgi:hypothetical protein